MQRRRLAEFGCDSMQGYHIGWLLEAEALRGWLGGQVQGTSARIATPA